METDRERDKERKRGREIINSSFVSTAVAGPRSAEEPGNSSV